MLRSLPRRCPAAGAAVLIVALASCGGGSSRTGSPAVTVAVELKDFAVSAPASVKSGEVHFTVHSVGPTMHEMVLVRTDLPVDKLPRTAAGNLAEGTQAPGVEHIEEVEALDIGVRKTLDVSLAPGRYVLFCNMDGHFAAGMNAAFEVTP